MLQKQYRFHGHGSLRYVYKNGKTIRGRSISLRYSANPHRENSRCAVVISRKVLKSAPKRNRVRRRIYEILRKNWQQLQGVYDIVVLVYDPRCFDMPHEELEIMLIDVLKKARIWGVKSSDDSSTHERSTVSI